VKADTPTATVAKRNEQYSAPWFVEPPGGTVATSAYNDGKTRCLSAEGGPCNPKKKVSEQNNTFTRAHSKSGRRLSVGEIRAEVQKFQKEMRDAARAAEMTEVEVTLEKPKDLAEKAAALKRGSRQRQARSGRIHSMGCNGASRQGQSRSGRSQAPGCYGAGG
jgi:ribosomal protein L13E